LALSNVAADSDVCAPDVCAEVSAAAELVVAAAESESLSSLHAATPKTAKPTRAAPAMLLRMFMFHSSNQLSKPTLT
jgi:hypothetical protein